MTDLQRDMFLMCSKSWKLIVTCFFIVRWHGSYGISFLLCLGFHGFVQVLWTFFFQVDVVFLDIKKGEKKNSGKWLDFLFHGVYGWKEMLEFLNNFNLWFWCGIRYCLLFHCGLKLIGFFMGSIWLICIGIANLFWNFDWLLSM